MLLLMLPFLRGMAVDAAVFLGAHLLVARLLRLPGWGLLRLQARPNAPNESRTRRTMVRLAGPLAVYLWAVAFFVAGNVSAGRFAARVSAPQGLPAATAGVRDGDRVVAVDGSPVRTFDEVRDGVRASAAAHRPLRMTLERESARTTLEVVPGPDGRIGILPSGERVSTPWASALGEGFAAPFSSIKWFCGYARDLLGSVDTHLLATVSGPTAVGADLRGEEDVAPRVLTGLGVEWSILWPLFVLFAGVAGVLGERRMRDSADRAALV
jgi:membrane-associated protease RseP (regulator of RpoE activity)